MTTRKEQNVLAAVTTWFETLRHMDRLNEYEHDLFIAAADWLWARGDPERASAEPAEWLPDDLVLSLPPSFVESLRVSSRMMPTVCPPAFAGGAPAFPATVPPENSKPPPFVFALGETETTVPTPSLAAQFDLEALPSGAYLRQPNLPDDIEPLSQTPEGRASDDEEPITVRDPSTMNRLQHSMVFAIRESEPPEY